MVRRGYYTAYGYISFVDGVRQEFASESEYIEYMAELAAETTE